MILLFCHTSVSHCRTKVKMYAGPIIIIFAFSLLVAFLLCQVAPFLFPFSFQLHNLAYDSSPEQLESSLAIFIVTFLLWQVQHLRKKLTELEEKQAVGEKEACKGEEDLAHLEEELLVKLKETTNMKGKRKPLSVMLEKEEKK